MTTDEMLLRGSDTNEAAEVSGQRTPRSAAAGRFVIRPQRLNRTRLAGQLNDAKLLPRSWKVHVPAKQNCTRQFESESIMLLQIRS